MIDKELIKKNFSKASKSYDSYSIIQKDIAHKLINLIKKNDDFKKILELGCGTGYFSGLLRNRFPYSDILSIDISENMTRIARKKNPSISFITDDFETLPTEFYSDFQLITSNSSIHWINNPGKFIKKIIKNKKKTKKILFSVFGNNTLYELKQIIKYPLASNYFLSKGDWVAILQESVPSNSSIHEESLIVHYPNLLSLLRSIKYTGVNVRIKKDEEFKWTRQKITQTEKEYLSRYGDIIASYEIFFIEISLPE